jgi:antirestriction protein ArdC
MTTTSQLRQQVNDTIIQALERGGVPWRSDHGFPKNVLSRRRYGGVEAICLMTTGCPSPYWGTRSEWEALGGKVLPGSPGTLIAVPRRRLFGSSLRPCTVSNLCQVSGDFPVSRNDRRTVDYALVDRVIANTGADIRFTDERVAEYHFPGADPDGDGDYIKMCRKEHFGRGPGGGPSFYHVVFHELAHWTEPGARCGFWGTPEVKELRAELASAFLTTELAVPGCPDSCRLIVHKHLDAWVNEMRRNPGTIFTVAASAARAADYVLNFTARVEPRHQPLRDGAA